LLATLGMIPNEYLYYYYYSRQAVENILQSGGSRGETIAALNIKLFEDLAQMKREKRLDEMLTRYFAYLRERGESYMARETGQSHSIPHNQESMASEGYAGVALNLIEGLTGLGARQMILNVPNQGAIHGLPAEAVVEIPAHVGRDGIRPLSVGEVPSHCLGLMKQVKEYERLTIAAAVESSYAKALLALTLHPLIHDYSLAKRLLDAYVQEHASLFPGLK
jgi:6-phospho-beta-glucosidase